MNSSNASKGSKTGIGEWWDGLALWIRISLLLLFGIAIAISANSFSIWLNTRISDSGRAEEIKNAQAEYDISVLKAKTAKNEFDAANLKRKSKIPNPAEFNSVKIATSFACETQEVMMQNFAAYSNSPQTVEQGNMLNFGLGCAWAQFDYKVTSLQGENYLIAFDRDYDDRSFDTCGKIAPNNDVSGRCIDAINGHIGKKFRVIMGQGGYLKIGGLL